MTQPLPRRLQALFPGETVRAGYAFFRDHAARPFDYLGQGPGLPANAWWAGQLALLAYVDEPDIRAGLAVAGLTLVAPVVDVDGLRAVVAASGDSKTVFVSFRGTVLPVPAWPLSQSECQEAAANWGKNLEAGLVTATAPGHGMVHSGFLNAWTRLKSGVEQALASIPDKRVVVWTGHSLGGALATVAAAFSTLPAGCSQVMITFGSPRVGDADFVAGLTTTHARFVLGSDAVPGLPPANTLGFDALPSYVHHGTKVALGFESPFFDGAEVVALIDRQIGLTTSRLEEIAAVVELATIPVPLRDHAMLLYAAKCA